MQLRVEPFDPAGCKDRRDGHVYWAARREVFRFRHDPAAPELLRAANHGIGGRTTLGLDLIPPAPDPADGEGCRGNPLRGDGVKVLWAVQTREFARLSGRPLDTQSMRAWVRGNYAVSSWHLGKAKSDGLWPRLHAQGRHCRQRPSGIVECLTGRGSDLDDYRTGRILRIPRASIAADDALATDLYVAIEVDPRDRAMVVSQFDAYGAVRLLDHFRILPGEIDLLIPYFRTLLGVLREARVPSYRWDPARGER